MAQQMQFHLQIKGEGDDRTFPLQIGETSIGRVDDNDIVLEHDFVSSNHARFDVTKTACFLTDLESTNGTLVDGKALVANRPKRLSTSSEIQVGPYQLSIREVAADEVPTKPKSERAPVGVVVDEKTAKAVSARSKPKRTEKTRSKRKQNGQAPPLPPPPAYTNGVLPEPTDFSKAPLGLSIHSSRLINYLPGIFHLPYDPLEIDLPLSKMPESALHSLIGSVVDREPEKYDPVLLKSGAAELARKLRLLSDGDDVEYDSADEESLIRAVRRQHFSLRSHRNNFLSRFLGIFEAILSPIEWTVDNFDLFMNPATAPSDFLPWLAQWFDLKFDSTWSETQRRELLKDAHEIFARRGTKWALARMLEIYVGDEVDIVDDGSDENPFSFTVRLPVTKTEIDAELVYQIIDSHKPAHATYELQLKRG